MFSVLSCGRSQKNFRFGNLILNKCYMSAVQSRPRVVYLHFGDKSTWKTLHMHYTLHFNSIRNENTVVGAHVNAIHCIHVYCVHTRSNRNIGTLIDIYHNEQFTSNKLKIECGIPKSERSTIRRKSA